MVEYEQPVGWSPRAVLTTSNLIGGSIVAETKSTTQKRGGQFGAAHPRWLGGKAGVRAGRDRALRRYRDVQPCENCGDQQAERHHRDGDTLNNEPENIAWLCRKCHMQSDGRYTDFVASSADHLKKAVKAAASRHIDTKARSGDRCPACGNTLSRVCSRPRSGHRMVYIGCRKSRSGCGYNAGSFREALE